MTLASPASTIILDDFKNPRQMVLWISALSHPFSCDWKINSFHSIFRVAFNSLSTTTYFLCHCFSHPQLWTILFHWNLLSTDPTVFSHLRALLPSLPRFSSKINHGKESCADPLNNHWWSTKTSLNSAPLFSLPPTSSFLSFPVFYPPLCMKFPRGRWQIAEGGSQLLL